MDDQKNTQQKKQASHFMAFYVVALFSIALVLILLSYLTQARADDQIAHAKTQLEEQVSATQGIQAKMEVLQEASNEQAQQITALQEALKNTETEKKTLEQKIKAQSGLLRACEYARREDGLEQMKAELDALEAEFGLEALDGSVPSKRIWTAEDAALFNELRGMTAENETM